MGSWYVIWIVMEVKDWKYNNYKRPNPEVCENLSVLYQNLLLQMESSESTSELTCYGEHKMKEKSW